jgi:hypothetical protein
VRPANFCSRRNSNMDNGKKLNCPAAPPQWEGSVAFAVVAGTAERPEAVYLDEPEPATPELLAAALPARPREVFRFAATCVEGACPHWTDEGQGRCTLVSTVLRVFDPAAVELPRCNIRKSCRWWHQEGKAACLRCVQIPTDSGELPADESETVFLADARYFRAERLARNR